MTAPVEQSRSCDLRQRLQAAASTLDGLPMPGTGATADRLEHLASIAARDLSLARVAEAHLDAVTILRESGREARQGQLYGVWASEAPHAVLEATTCCTGITIDGRKAFCSGVGVVDRALVTARVDGSVVLVDLPARDDRIASIADDWVTPAFADTATATIAVDGLRVARDDMVGGPNWYLQRIGFWHGALAPAACWAGGAIGLAIHCLVRAAGGRLDSHTSAHLGVLDAVRWELGAVLRAAGDQLDEARGDVEFAMRHAYRVRAVIERLVGVVVDHASRAFGPRLLAFDAWAALRVSELQLYVRQHHGSRDHAALAHLVVEG